MFLDLVPEQALLELECGELVMEGVLLKNKNVYSISVEWVGLLKEFTSSLPACAEIV